MVTAEVSITDGLREFLKKNTRVYSDNLDVFPWAEEGTSEGEAILIDVHYGKVGVDASVKGVEESFVEFLLGYPAQERLRGGPSYLEVAQAYNITQGEALQFMAVGEALKLWNVMTPKRMNIEEGEVDELAGRGFIIITGWKS